MNAAQNYFDSALDRFKTYQRLGAKAMNQVPDSKLNWSFNDESNSISINVKHMHGNMLSRWSDFLNSDGEKPERKRDAEFEEELKTREAIINAWEEGWRCLFDALEELGGKDMMRFVKIRNENHTVIEAVNRQLCHYAYHVGQIVYLSKMIVGTNWKSISIPKGGMEEFNQKFVEK